MSLSAHQEVRTRIDALTARVADLKSGGSQVLLQRQDELSAVIDELSNLVAGVGAGTDVHEQYRATFDHAGVGFAHVSIDGKWLLVNSKLCSILGYTRSELLSLNLDDVAYPDESGIGPTALGRVISGELESCKLEMRFTCKDAETRWAMVTATSIRSSNEYPERKYIFCVVQDITDRKKAAYTLQKSLRLLSTAEQIAGTGGWEFDVLTRTISRSDELSRMIGIPLTAAPSPIERVLDLIHPDDREMMATSLNASIRDCKPYLCKYRLTRPDGREIVVSVRGEPVADSLGSVVRVIGSTQDVTAKEEADRVLEQRRRMSLLSCDLGAALTPNHSLRKTLKQCADAMIRHLDAALVRIWTHNVEENTFELRATSTHVNHWNVDEADIQVHVDVHLRQIVAEHKPYVTSTFLAGADPDGSEGIRRESITAYMPLTVNNTLVGALGICSRHALTDVRMEALASAADAIALGIQRRKAEVALRQLNADLEHTVGKRTAQLQAALAELDQFTYSAAHELRAPLKGIDDLTEAVVKEFEPQMPEQARLYLHRVRNSAKRMQKLIDDLLSLSYLGKQPLNMQLVEIGPLVDDVISELRLLHSGRHIEILAADLPACQCDPHLIRQVFVNLLSNAFKYTSQNAAARIEVGYFNRGGEHVFFVRDNGVGFEMQYAHKLFDAFQRFHKAEDFDGSGIGLAIVQRIVNRHGGAAWAESQPGEGATFYISLN